MHWVWARTPVFHGQVLRLGFDWNGWDQVDPPWSQAGRQQEDLINTFPQRGKIIFQFVPFVSSSGDKVPQKCQSEPRSNEGLF